MPEKKIIKRARHAKQEGKSPGTQAGEFVHEEIKRIREGKHGARSAKQVIAKFTNTEQELLTLLKKRVEKDEQMLLKMKMRKLN